MPTFAVLFMVGDACVQSFEYLPIKSIWLALLVVVLSIYFATIKPQLCRVALAGFLCGVAWSSFSAYEAAEGRLSPSDEAKPINAEGYIQSIPIKSKFGYRFSFAITSSASKNLVHKLVRLRWATMKHLRVGDKYNIYVRLKRIHGLRNPGTYNYEVWGLHERIAATGSVLKSKPNRFIKHTWKYPVNQLRQYFNDLILAHIPETKTSGWILALTIGERYLASQKDWEILRLTGTNHLMAIAGLHVGMISGFVFLLCRFLWCRFSKLCFICPAQLAAELCALSFAWFYSALAGFALPTQRACIMLSLFILVRIMRMKVSAFSVWSLTLLTVLFFEPLSMLTISFWLSFLTIALIIYGMRGRIAPVGWWWDWFRIQWVIGVGLVPLSLYLFQEASLVGIFVNSLVIPLLSFFILPLALTGSLLLPIFISIGQYLLMLADTGLSLLWSMLGMFANVPYVAAGYAISSVYLLICGFISCLLIIAPAGMPARLLASIFAFPVFIYSDPIPALGDFWVTLLDVGQGLSVVVRTNKHNLVFDAGAKFGDKFDMGSSVVVPYLNAKHIKFIDRLVISHADNDHAGGRFAVLQHLHVNTTFTGEPGKLHISLANACLAGQSWAWDGVLFEVLHPLPSELNLGNDSSCVLRVSNHGASLLLTGDIEKIAEQHILERNAHLAADILIAPHHGSKTSGLSAFLNRVDPLYVLIPAGYRNRYKLPHAAILRQYKEKGYLVLNTAEAGAIEFHIKNDAVNIKPTQYRYLNRHYWDVF